MAGRRSWAAAWWTCGPTKPGGTIPADPACACRRLAAGGGCAPARLLVSRRRRPTSPGPVSPRRHEAKHVRYAYYASPDGTPHKLEMHGTNALTGAHFDRWVVEYTGFAAGRPEPAAFATPALCQGVAPQRGRGGRRTATQLRLLSLVPAVRYGGDSQVRLLGERQQEAAAAAAAAAAECHSSGALCGQAPHAQACPSLPALPRPVGCQLRGCCRCWLLHSPAGGRQHCSQLSQHLHTRPAQPRPPISTTRFSRPTAAGAATGRCASTARAPRCWPPTSAWWMLTTRRQGAPTAWP